ncbi:hypothetical protein HYU19_01375 [Candidatus Woesearchaeota archaeon]|nr:hypothetical protein [Candidatus Woesearchaeota archaeon]
MNDAWNVLGLIVIIVLLAAFAGCQATGKSTEATPAADTTPEIVAYPQPCGNGVLEGGEECDDGNANDGDGCGSECKAGPLRTCIAEQSELAGHAGLAGTAVHYSVGTDCGIDHHNAAGCSYTDFVPACTGPAAFESYACSTGQLPIKVEGTCPAGTACLDGVCG